MIHGRIKYNAVIHSRAHIIKAFLGILVSCIPFMKVAKNDLVVLNYHGTQKRFLNNFRRQIEFFKAHYHIISPSDLDAFFKNEIESSDKPYLLFNFDDGIKSNLYAAEVLNEYGISALFFVVPEFVNSPHEDQPAFFRKKIDPTFDPQINKETEDSLAMSWHDLKKLVAEGHEVGSHSSTHTMRVAGADDQSRHYEIVASQRMLAERLGLRPDQVGSFCGPIDSLLSVGAKELNLIREKYQFLFSTFPGSNHRCKDPYFIKRVHVEAFWMLSTVKFALSRLDMIRYIRKVKFFKSLT